jgi:hypothetical protein
VTYDQWKTTDAHEYERDDEYEDEPEDFDWLSLVECLDELEART